LATLSGSISTLLQYVWNFSPNGANGQIHAVTLEGAVSLIQYEASNNGRIFLPQ